jgi:hypothetical protein
MNSANQRDLSPPFSIKSFVHQAVEGRKKERKRSDKERKYIKYIENERKED